MPRLNLPVYPQDTREMDVQSSDVDTTAATAGGSTDRLLRSSPENEPGENTDNVSVRCRAGSSVYSVESETSDPFTDNRSDVSNAGSFVLTHKDSIEVVKDRAKRGWKKMFLAKMKSLGSRRGNGRGIVGFVRMPSLREKVQGWFGAAS